METLRGKPKAGIKAARTQPLNEMQLNSPSLRDRTPSPTLPPIDDASVFGSTASTTPRNGWSIFRAVFGGSFGGDGGSSPAIATPMSRMPWIASSQTAPSLSDIASNNIPSSQQQQQQQLSSSVGSCAEIVGFDFDPSPAETDDESDGHGDAATSVVSEPHESQSQTMEFGGWCDSFIPAVVDASQMESDVSLAADGANSPPQSFGVLRECDFPKFDNPSGLLSQDEFSKVLSWMPRRFRLGGHGEPRVVFRAEKDGYNQCSLFRRVKNVTPLLFVVSTIGHPKGTTFGAFLTEQLVWSPGKYYGCGEAFLFRMQPDPVRYEWLPGQNSLFVHVEKLSFSFGGGGGIGLWVDEDMQSGVSESCDTFCNEPLNQEGKEFDIADLEVITFK